MLSAKVIPRRRRWDGPLERSAVPGILWSWGPFEAAEEEVVEEDHLAEPGEDGGVGDELVDRDEGEEEVVCEGRVAADVARQA